MTSTTDSVVSWRVMTRAGVFALVAGLGAAIAGCSGGNLLGTNSAGPTTAALAPPAAAQPAPVSQSRVAIAPIVGAPDAVGKQLSGMLASSLQSQRVMLAHGTEKPDYTLRGYMVAAKEKGGVKVSYIWDLTDPSGKRANRIQGEEIAANGNSRDPWSALTPTMMQTISNKTSTSLVTALAGLTPTVARTSAPVGVGGATHTAAAPVSRAATGSIPASPAAATSASGVIVTPVSGAPGDGNGALMTAMQSELRQAGIASAGPGAPSYKVTGKVTMGRPNNGKQSIRIDWKVSDPSGSVLATVTQNNEIQAGLLDAKWGGTATDAAQGAAIKIKTLIDEHRLAQGGSSAKRSRG
ncbi:MAG: hypothetical protein AB7O43_18190 [Hyphomicrobiaceae bacterium]